MSLSRTELLATRKAHAELPRKPVDIPGVGTVFVRMLTGAEFDRLTFVIESGREKDEVSTYTGLTLFAACDESGQRLFGDADLDAVKALPVPVVLAIGKAANGLNKFEDADVEEEVKNSDDAPSGG